MGWSGGTDIATAVIKSAKKNIKDKEARRAFYHDFLDAMEDSDWDTQDEAMEIDPLFDEVLSKRNEDGCEDESEE